jgi:hypothetical protein
VLTQLTRRIVGLGVSIFATLGFLSVPLGERTGFQHAKAIVLSDEASHFGRALRRAIAELERQLQAELRDEPPPEPRSGLSQRPKQGARSTLARSAPARPTSAGRSRADLSSRSDLVPWCSERAPD